jgi:hypothetical protein
MPDIRDSTPPTSVLDPLQNFELAIITTNGVSTKTVSYHIAGNEYQCFSNLGQYRRKTASIARSYAQ